MSFFFVSVYTGQGVRTQPRRDTATEGQQEGAQARRGQGEKKDGQ